MSRTMWTAVVLLAVVPLVVAEQPETLRKSRGEGVAPPSKLDRVRELLDAAEHLWAAGERPLAREVRRQAQTWLLEEQARLHREQEMFRTLSHRSDAAADVRITINALLVEVPPEGVGRLRKVLHDFGAEPAAMGDGLPHGGAVQLRAGADANEVLRRLAGADVAVRVLSRPQILSLDGQPAEIQVGQAAPVVNGVVIDSAGRASPLEVQEFAGVRLELTPLLLDDSQVELQLRAGRSRYLAERVPIFSFANGDPPIDNPVKDEQAATTVVRAGVGRVTVFPQLLPGTRTLRPDAPARADDAPDLLLFLTPVVQLAPER